MCGPTFHSCRGLWPSTRFFFGSLDRTGPFYAIVFFLQFLVETLEILERKKLAEKNTKKSKIYPGKKTLIERPCPAQRAKQNLVQRPKTSAGVKSWPTCYTLYIYITVLLSWVERICRCFIFRAVCYLEFQITSALKPPLLHELTTFGQMECAPAILASTRERENCWPGL